MTERIVSFESADIVVIGVSTDPDNKVERVFVEIKVIVWRKLINLLKFLIILVKVYRTVNLKLRNIF